MEDTIFALSTGQGRAAVAVIRLSGPDSDKALEALLQRQNLPKARQASLRKLKDPKTQELLDLGLVIRFPGPESFTGEDVVELQIHGGTAVIASVLNALSCLPNLRPAEAGEFSRRAFAHGRMDLTEIEGLSDLLSAETACQRQQALSQMEGALSHVYQAWADRLTHILAHLEAAIDFVDEEDIPQDLEQDARKAATEITCEIKAHLNDGHRGERLRDGLKVVVLGEPNAGKSSLVNAIAGRDVAIVTSQAGTTRDIIEIRLDLNGWPVLIADTAGLRESEDLIEKEGIARAKAWGDSADLKVIVIDSMASKISRDVVDLIDENTIIVLNKKDLWQKTVKQAQTSGKDLIEQYKHLCEKTQQAMPIAFVPCIAKESEGLENFFEVMEQAAEHRMGRKAETPILTRPRHRAALTDCLYALERIEQAPLAELMTEEVRLAVRALGRLTGKVDVEDLLDVIFSEFCIGK